MWNLVIGSLSKITKARVQDYFKLSWILLWHDRDSNVFTIQAVSDKEICVYTD